MPTIGRSVVGLIITGDDLDPDEITDLIKARPNSSARKGDPRPTNPKVYKTGHWRFALPGREPGDLDSQIIELFEAMTPNLAVWSSIAHRFKATVSCGLFMGVTNEEAMLSPATLIAIGERGLTLWLDIYDPVIDDTGTD